MSFIISSKKFKNNIPKPEITFAPKNVFLQNFRYPKPIMNYLKTIPNSMTPKLYINLLKCCKYFYSKKDLIIPLNDIYRYELWKIILSKKEPTKFKLHFKIWLTGSFYAAKLNDYYDTYFLKYAARCNIINIKLQVQEITFKKFEFLINNGVERFFCNRTTIKYCNGTVVPVEKIFAHLKSVKYVRYTFGGETAKLVTAETAKELTKVIDTSKLEKIYFYRISTAFDFETFKKFTQAQISLEDEAFRKIDINEQETFTNMTLLHYACQYGSEKIVTDLILKGANINFKDSNGNLPLHFAAAGTDNIQIIEAIINVISKDERNICITEYIYTKNISDFNAFRLAVEHKRGNIVKYLLKLYETYSLVIDNLQLLQLSSRKNGFSVFSLLEKGQDPKGK